METNFITAAICRSNGGKPASVCDSPGVKAAEKVIAATKQVS
jgi:succinyl-CoA synthetase beta subunit